MANIFVGRFCPLHIGHVDLIKSNLHPTLDNNIIFIGSSATNLCDRIPFTFLERTFFIKQVFPNIRCIGIPDVWENTVWISMFDQYLKAIFSGDRQDHTVFGGSFDDLEIYYKHGYNIKIHQRSPEISGTICRKKIISGESIRDLIPEEIDSNFVTERYLLNRKKFQ